MDISHLDYCLVDFWIFFFLDLVFFDWCYYKHYAPVFLWTSVFMTLGEILTPGSKISSQETPGVTGKFGLRIRNEAGQRLIRVLPRECAGHSKHPLLTTQEKTLHVDITRWSTPKSDWLYSLQPKMEKLYTVSKNKTGGLLWLRSWTPYCQIQT